MRTWIDFSALAGVPQGQWKNNPFLVWPFKAFVPDSDLCIPDYRPDTRCGHPVYLSFVWRKLLDDNLELTTRDIGDTQGLTPGRVRQILRLSKLAPQIISELQNMPTARLQRVSETRLRKLVPLGPDAQIEGFENLLHSL